MRKTKKLLVGILFFTCIFITIFAMANVSMAAIEHEDNVFEVTCSAPKAAAVGQTKEIPIVYSLENFNTTTTRKYATSSNEKGGVDALLAVLEYDATVFEEIEITTVTIHNESTNEDVVVSGGVKPYSSGTTPIATLDKWTQVTYNPNTVDREWLTDYNIEPGCRSMVINTSEGNFTGDNERFLQLTLRVKPNAPTGDSVVKLRVLEASNSSMTYWATNKELSTTISIVEVWGDPTDADLENGFGGYIRFLPNTKLSELKSTNKYPEVSSFKKYDESSKTFETTVNDDDYVPTGTQMSDSNVRYTLIAIGDINADGRLATVDISQVRQLIVKKDLLSDSSDQWGTGTSDPYGVKDNGLNQARNRRRAADIVWDGLLNTLDVSNQRRTFIGLTDFDPKKWSPATGGPTDQHAFPVRK